MDDRQARSIKIGLGILVAIGVAVLAYFVVSETKAKGVSARWDEFAQIQEIYGPQSPLQDPLFEGPGDPYRARRVTFIEKLEEFLKQDGVKDDPALAPHVHWLIAKLSADQALSDKEELDAERRGVAWQRSIEHTKILRDEYPDFQTNWEKFAPPGEASLTKRLLYTLEANAQWEKEHLPRPREPSGSDVVVLRTERGDMRIGLYSEEAPELTKRFLERVVAGRYDGTAFTAKADTDKGGKTENAAIRGGHPLSRGAEPFERDQHAGFAAREQEDPVLPAPTRWLMPIGRGVVVAWHEAADEYDGAQQVLVVTDRSPLLDYRYSPIGKLLDEDSLATADRIFEGAVWRDDLDLDTSTDDGRRVADFFQAPVRIVKALAYDANGDLREPAAGADEGRATIEESERTLSGLVKDAYLANAPERPAPPPIADEGDEAAPEDPEDAEDEEDPEDDGNE